MAETPAAPEKSTKNSEVTTPASQAPEATAEAPSAPVTTPYVDWIIPMQDKIEQVVDARLAAHAASEKADKKTSSRSR